MLHGNPFLWVWRHVECVFSAQEISVIKAGQALSGLFRQNRPSPSHNPHLKQFQQQKNTKKNHVFPAKSTFGHFQIKVNAFFIDIFLF